MRAPADWSEYLRNAASNISWMAQLSLVWINPCWTSSSDRTCGVSEFREIMQFSCLFILSCRNIKNIVSLLASYSQLYTSNLRSILRLMCPSFFSVSSKSHWKRFIMRTGQVSERNVRVTCIERILLFSTSTFSCSTLFSSSH